RPRLRDDADGRARGRAARALPRLRQRRRQGGPDRLHREAQARVQREVAMPNVDELLQGARDAIAAKRVYADPVERDGVTVVPAASVRGGGGGGGDNATYGGAGFGLAARPVGAYVIGPGERVEWKPAIDVQRMVLGWQVVAGLTVLAVWSL